MNQVDSPTVVQSGTALPDIPFARIDLGEAEIAAVVECLRSGWLTAGAKVAAFESALAERMGVRHVVTFNSATMAALVLMEALGIGPGQEVIVPTWTFSGPAMMVHKLGARVVLADVDLATFNLTAETAAGLFTSRTAAVMPTHFAGLVCDMPALTALCDARRVPLIDDAAHAFTSTDTAGRWVGAQDARASFFSFYATKPLTTGEGGMAVTDCPDLAQRLRVLRCHGLTRDAWNRNGKASDGWRYEIVAPGWKANMTDVEASIGLVQLQRSAEMLDGRRRVAERYHGGFAEAEQRGWLIRPQATDGHSWHLYSLRVACDRDVFIRQLAQIGIRCSAHFIPLHKHRFWRETAVNGEAVFPNADLLDRQEVSLPIYAEMSETEIERVVEGVLRTSRRVTSTMG